MPSPEEVVLRQEAQIEALRRELMTEKDAHIATGHALGGKNQELFLELAAMTAERTRWEEDARTAKASWDTACHDIANLQEQLNEYVRGIENENQKQ